MLVQFQQLCQRVVCGVMVTGAVASSGPVMGQEVKVEAPPAAAAAPKCDMDLTLPGVMSDIVSNVLLRSMNLAEADVRAFLKDAKKQHNTGEELMRATAQHFQIDQAKFAAEVERYRHVNCRHEPVAGYVEPDRWRQGAAGAREAAFEVTPFARDVVMHVVLHELGHGLIREFDLPILGNEETMADAFATHYLVMHMPDRAVEVLKARVTSLMIEAGEVPREQWPVRGEHDNDARRAFQIAALAVAADADKFAPVAACVAMSEKDITRAKDYGAEIHRSWRRTLNPLWMPGTTASSEARVVCDDDNVTFTQGAAAELAAELESVIARFDWHSQVKVRFATGDGGASWSRGSRTITVHNGYVRRFVEQGKKAAGEVAAAKP